MPELPFLEVLAENLASRVSGRRIESILIRQPALLQTSAPAPESFVGEFLSLPGRVGKYLILETESRRAIVIHLMRAGRLAVTPSPGSAADRGAPAKGRVARGPALLKHLSARIWLWLAEDSSDVPELGRLGPDPSRGELTYERFRSAMDAASRQLKTFLTDQRAIAGIGNGLSDEILYEARLSPMRLTGSLTEPEARALHLALLAVVSAQTEKLRESMSGELPQKEPREHYRVHDHAGTKCPRCGAAIARVSFADHEIFYCPGCQTGGKPLKDRRLSKLLK